MLPFLKESKRPRIAPPETEKLQEEKIIHGSDQDYLDAHCAREYMNAVKEKDPQKLLAAVQAIVMSQFERESPDAA